MAPSIDYRSYAPTGKDSLSWSEAREAAAASLHELVGDLGNGQVLGWWLSSVPSRNPYSSPLYSNLAILHHIEIKCRVDWRDGKSRQLIVQSQALKKIILKFLSQKKIAQISVVVIEDISTLNRLAAIAKCCLGHLLRYLTLRFCGGLKPACLQIDCLIDMYVYKGWVSGDRYYAGLFDSLRSIPDAKVFIAPEFVSFNPSELVKQINLFKREFDSVLIKELFLNFSDFLKAIVNSLFGVRAVKGQQLIFCDLNVNSLIEEEISRRCGIDQTIRGWLNFYFFRRMKEGRFSFKNIINWFENQSIDKGWNAGVNKFFPSARSIGYQAFSDMPGYFCMFPTAAEWGAGILPKELAAVGEGYKASRTRYYPDLKFSIAPAFRFQHVWQSIEIPLSQRSTVLVALPIDLGLAKKLLREALLISDEWWLDHGLSLKFRLHPTTPLHALGLNEFEISRVASKLDEASFSVSIGSSRLMIGVFSSACLEAVARSVPVVLLELSFDKFSSMPPETPAEMVAKFGVTQDLQIAIKSVLSLAYSQNPDTEKKIAHLKSLYFKKVDLNGIKAFLGIF